MLKKMEKNLGGDTEALRKLQYFRVKMELEREASDLKKIGEPDQTALETYSYLMMYSTVA
jgi:hypothetical protein